MATTVVFVALVGAAVLAVWGASTPRSVRHGDEGAARRRYVERHPMHVGSHDIRCALVHDGVAPEQADLITAKAAEHGIRPFTMWLWLRQFDAEALGIVVAADLSHQDLLTHIADGTVPDLEELALFASANGLEVAGPPVRPRGRKVLVDSGAALPRTSLPPIHEPGSWGGLAPAGPPRRPGHGGLAA